MAIQTQVLTKVVRKKETVFGTLPGTSGGREVRKVSDSLAMQKSQIQSAAIQTNAQRPMAAAGGRTVSGNFGVEMALGLIDLELASVLRRDWTAVPDLDNLTITASDTAPNFVRSAGSFITDGLAVGMLIKPSGFTGGGVANNDKMFTIIALTATEITVAEPVVDAASASGIDIIVPGKITYIPETGHTNDSYTIEKWYSAVLESYRFKGQRVASVGFSLAANDKVSVDIAYMGQDREKETSAYFVNPAQPGGGDMLVTPSGMMVVNGKVTKVCTNFSCDINGNATVGNVVGSNITPDVFMGMIDVTGQISVYYENGDMDTYFDEGTPITLINRLNDDIGGALIISMPYVKIFGGSESGDSEIIRQYDYTAAPNLAGVGAGKSTIMIQDTSLT